MAIRVECMVDGLTDAWLEVSEAGWTLAAIDKLSKLPATEILAAFRQHVTGCFLPMLTGEAITEPAALTEADFRERMDSRLMWFIGSGIYAGAEASKSLSPFAVSVSLPGSGKAKADSQGS